MNAKQLERRAGAAIRKLRLEKLKRGLPFMINTDMLVPGQCFLEYPDGIIKIAEADISRTDFQIVYEFSAAESDRLRKKLKIA